MTKDARQKPQPERRRPSRTRSITHAAGARRAALVRYRRTLVSTLSQSQSGVGATPRKRLREQLWTLWTKNIVRLLPLGGLSEGNDIEVYFSGDVVFKQMIAAISGASSRVWMESYIFEADRLGVQVRDALCAAAERGCEVRLVIDAVGSQGTSDAFFDDLRKAGGDVRRFNPPSLRRLFWPAPRTPSVLMRDHRKILVVDDHVAFAGGMNVGEDYAGPELGNLRFRDSHVEVHGPAVLDLMGVFAESYEDVTGKLLAVPTKVDVRPRDALLQVLRSNARKHQSYIQRALKSVLAHAGERCFITTPYFIPSRSLVRALINAARRGVDVRILTAGKSDVALAKWAAEVFYTRLLKVGVRIYEYQARTLHAKTLSVDGAYGTVGSFNLDHWSARRNNEVIVGAYDQDVATTLEAQFLIDIEGAHEIARDVHSGRSWYKRIRSTISYYIARL